MAFNTADNSSAFSANVVCARNNNKPLHEFIAKIRHKMRLFRNTIHFRRTWNRRSWCAKIFLIDQNWFFQHFTRDIKGITTLNIFAKRQLFQVAPTWRREICWYSRFALKEILQHFFQWKGSKLQQNRQTAADCQRFITFYMPDRQLKPRWRIHWILYVRWNSVDRAFSIIRLNSWFILQRWQQLTLK